MIATLLLTMRLALADEPGTSPRTAGLALADEPGTSPRTAGLALADEPGTSPRTPARALADEPGTSPRTPALALADEPGTSPRTAGLALADDPSPPMAALPLPELHPKRPLAERFGTAAFRTSIPAAGPAVTTRLAFVQDLDGTSIGELTLAGQMGWHVFGLAVETAATAGVSPRWSSAGFGNTVIDARVLFGRGSTHAIGVRGTLATGNRGGANGPVAWWGTVPAATVPTWGLALAYEGATARWVWHAHIGFHTNRWAYSYTSDVWDAGASLATIQPLAERWDLVGEVEVLSAWSPVHLRALARVDLGHGWTVDGGLALPAAVFFQDPTLQVLGRVAFGAPGCFPILPRR